MSSKRLTDKRILILEDDFYIADDEKSLLEGAGAQVVGPFGSGCSQDDIDGAGRLDGAIIDINLGRGPNFDVPRRLRERGVPFIFVTGYDEAVIPADLSDAPRIEKPIDERTYVLSVAKMVENA